MCRRQKVGIDRTDRETRYSKVKSIDDTQSHRVSVGVIEETLPLIRDNRKSRSHSIVCVASRLCMDTGGWELYYSGVWEATMYVW